MLGQPLQCTLFWNNEELFHCGVSFKPSSHGRKFAFIDEDEMEVCVPDRNRTRSRRTSAGTLNRTGRRTTVPRQINIEPESSWEEQRSEGSVAGSSSAGVVTEDSSSEHLLADDMLAAASCGKTGPSVVNDHDVTTSTAEPSLMPCEWCGSCYACECAEALMLQYCSHATERSGEGFEAAGIRKDQPAMSDDWDVSTILSEADESLPSTGVPSVESGSTDGNEIISKAEVPDDQQHVKSSASPDFNGTWLLSRIEGDMEALMADAGVGWTIRRIARSINYGIGMLSQKIEHTDDTFSIEYQTGPNVYTSRFIVGAGKQDTLLEDGANVTVTPVWTGQAVSTRGNLKNGTAIQPNRRFLDGQDMVIETTMTSGAVVKRFFSQK